jgi:hypothetical protein
VRYACSWGLRQHPCSLRVLCTTRLKTEKPTLVLHLDERLCNPMQVFTENRDTWVLVALPQATRTPHGAEYIFSNLLSAVRKAMRQHKSNRPGSHGDLLQIPEISSPLTRAVEGLCTSFAHASPSSESLLPQASLSAAVIHPSSQSAHSLWFGMGSQAPIFYESRGDRIAPATHSVRFSSHTNLHEAYHKGLSGTLSLVLGSRGLW